MSLPSVNSPPRPQSSAEEAPRMAERILIVDDTRVNLSLLRSILRARGCELIEATDGEQAVQQAIEGHPDLILLDVMMPYVDGPTVCRRLAEHESAKEIPVIILTGRGQGLSKFGASPNVAACVDKPFDPETLKQTVREVLGR